MYNNFKQDNSDASNGGSYYTSASYGKGNDDGSYDSMDYGRPRSVTVVAWLLVISLVLGLIQVAGLLQYANDLPGWVWLVLLVDYGLLITAITGLFKMKKYGVFAFVAQIVVSTVFTLAAGAGSTGIINLVASVIMLAFVLMKISDFE